MPARPLSAASVLVALALGSAGVLAQPAPTPDGPQASLETGERLVLALGQPWAEAALGLAAPDSGTVAGGAGRLAWSVPGYAVDAFRAEIRGAIVVAAVLDFSDAGPDFSAYADRLRERHGAPSGDGFFDADATGFPFDVAVWPDAHRLDFRAVDGRTVPAGTPLPIQFRAASSDEGPAPRDTSPIVDAAEESPQIVGGLRALMARVGYPPSAFVEGVVGTVLVQLVVDTDGRASEVSALRSPDERLSAEAVRAVRETTFRPGRTGGLPVRTRFAVPVRFAMPTVE